MGRTKEGRKKGKEGRKEGRNERKKEGREGDKDLQRINVWKCKSG